MLRLDVTRSRHQPKTKMRSYIPFVAGALAVLSTTAIAQPAITIYGRADVGVSAQSNRATNGMFYSVGNGMWNPSQIGFKGHEELGGGLSTIFDMGTTVIFDTGALASTTKVFDRNAWVGISDSRYGSLTLGRQLNTLSETFFVADPLGTRNGATNPNVRFGYLVGPGTAISNHFGPSPGVTGASLDRVDNSIKYSVLSQGTGLSGSAMLAAAEENGGNSGGALVGYDKGPLKARIAYMESHDANGIPLKAYAAGVSYKMTPFTLKATYAYNRIQSNVMTDTQPYGNLRTRVASSGVVWSITPTLDISFAYYRASRTQDSVAQQVAQKFYITSEYWLSKRTSLAFIVLREKFNSTGAALDTGTPLIANSRGSTYLGTVISHAF